MNARKTPILVHLAGAATASALAAYAVLRLLEPSSTPAPPSSTVAVAPDPDSHLAARMFGDVATAAADVAHNIQVSGVYSAGRNSAAVIVVDGKPARAVLLNREVVSGTRLVEVRADGITLETNGGRAEYAVPPVEVAKSSGASPGFRRDGDTLTAPSQELPATAAPGRPMGAAQGASGFAPDNGERPGPARLIGRPSGDEPRRAQFPGGSPFPGLAPGSPNPPPPPAGN